MKDENIGLSWKRFLEESFHIGAYATNVFDFSHVKVPVSSERKQFLSFFKESIDFRKKFFPSMIMIIPEHRKKVHKWVTNAFPDERFYFAEDRKSIRYPWQDILKHAYACAKENVSVNQLRWEYMILPEQEELQDFKRKFEALFKYPAFKKENVLKQFYKWQSRKDKPLTLWEREVFKYVRSKLEAPLEMPEEVLDKPPVHFVISVTKDEEKLSAQFPNLRAEKIQNLSDEGKAIVASEAKKIDPLALREVKHITFVRTCPPLDIDMCSLDLAFSKVMGISCTPQQNLILRSVKSPLILDARLTGNIFFQDTDFSKGISFINQKEGQASNLVLFFDTKTWQSLPEKNKKELMQQVKVVLKNTSEPLCNQIDNPKKKRMSSKLVIFNQSFLKR